jgi:hypothetical protein
MGSPDPTRVHFMKHDFYELTGISAVLSTAVPVAFVKSSAGRRAMWAGRAGIDNIRTTL